MDETSGPSRFIRMHDRFSLSVYTAPMAGKWWTALLAMLAFPASALAQVVQLPSLPNVTGRVGGLVPAVPLVEDVRQAAQRLAAERLDRLARIARRNPDAIALDRAGNPVRAGEVVVGDPDDATVAAIQSAGFRLIERTTLDGLGMGFARFGAPRGLSIEGALKRVRKLAVGRDVTADPLHFESGDAPRTSPWPSPPAPPAQGGGARIGIIDGGVATNAVGGAVAQTGFAAGAPAANGHATAVASLISGGPGVRGGAPGTALYVADVYGRDPAGGSATAIAKALAWLVSLRVPVVTISLVGPPNPLLARVIAATQARGTLVVAAVGNDGPAAPPAYPASYPGVIAVTGVDGGNRALIEAGRAEHLDYAAPGADLLAASPGGRAVTVRGTSFAAPFVAARLLAFYATPDPARMPSALRALDGEARDLGPRGADRTYGRGLVCGDCRTKK